MPDYSSIMIFWILLVVVFSSCCTVSLREKHVCAIQILLSNDCHPNPGPTYKFPCGVCQKPCKSNQNCVACDSCDVWFHIKCMEMPIEVFKTVQNTSWICCNCGSPNCSTTIYETLLVDSIATQNSYSSLSEDLASENDPEYSKSSMSSQSFSSLDSRLANHNTHLHLGDHGHVLLYLSLPNPARTCYASLQ